MKTSDPLVDFFIAVYGEEEYKRMLEERIANLKKELEGVDFSKIDIKPPKPYFSCPYWAECEGNNL